PFADFRAVRQQNSGLHALSFCGAEDLRRDDSNTPGGHFKAVRRYLRDDLGGGGLTRARAAHVDGPRCSGDSYPAPIARGVLASYTTAEIHFGLHVVFVIIPTHIFSARLGLPSWHQSGEPSPYDQYARLQQVSDGPKFLWSTTGLHQASGHDRGRLWPMGHR